MYSLEDVDQAAGQAADLGRDREAEADRVAGRRVGVLADDQHADVGQRLAKCAQDVLRRPAGNCGLRRSRPGGNRPAPVIARRDRLQCLRPVWGDQFAQGACRHGSPL